MLLSHKSTYGFCSHSIEKYETLMAEKIQISSFPMTDLFDLLEKCQKAMSCLIIAHTAYLQKNTIIKTLFLCYLPVGNLCSRTVFLATLSYFSVKHRLVVIKD